MKLLSKVIWVGSLVFTTQGYGQVDFSGQLRLRNDHKQLSHSSKDKNNVFDYRARLNFEKKQESGLKFYLSIQGTKNYGEVISATNDESDSSVYSSGDKYHSGVDLFQGYVESKKGDLTYKIGRQTLAYGDNLILGSRNWTTGGLAYDAFKLNWGKLDLVYSQISEGDSVAKSDDNTMLTFLYYKAIKEKSQELDTYVIHHNDRSDYESVSLGIRYKQSWDSWDVRTENIAQNHTNLDSTEHTVNLEVGYKAGSLGRFYIGAAQASENFDQLFTNRHKFNGLIDIVGRRNLNTYELGYKKSISDKLKLTLKYLSFSQKSTGVGAYNQPTSSVISGNVEESQIGQEVDLNLDYSLSKGESLGLGVSSFDHGDYFNDDPDNSHFTYLQYLIKF